MTLYKFNDGVNVVRFRFTDDAAFEAKVNRDAEGQFAEKGTGSVAPQKQVQQESVQQATQKTLPQKTPHQKASPEEVDSSSQITATQNATRKFDPKKFKELCGPEFKGVKGQDAVNLLLREKRGHVKGAFFRKEIGSIDLLWGDETLGLCHIIQRRSQQKNLDVDAFLSDLEEVVEKGSIRADANRNNYEIFWKNKKCIVSKTFYGENIHLVITEFPSRK